MDDHLEKLKTELQRFGETNDSSNREHGQRMRNVTRDTGEFLTALAWAAMARRILEIGTSRTTLLASCAARNRAHTI